MPPPPPTAAFEVSETRATETAPSDRSSVRGGTSRKLLLALLDLLAVVVAFYLSVFLRNYFFAWRGGVYTPTWKHLWFLAGLGLVILLYFRNSHLYLHFAFAPSANHLEKLTRAWITFIGFFIAVTFFLRVQLFIEHRITMLLFIGLGWLLLYLGRFIAVPAILVRLGDRDSQTSRILIVGSRRDLRNLLGHLKETRLNLGRVMGLVGDPEDGPAATTTEPAYLGPVTALPEILRRHEVDELFINLAHQDWQTISEVRRLAHRSGPLLRIALPHFGALQKRVAALPEVYDDYVYVNHSVFTDAERVCKRGLDLVVALAGLILLAPLFLVLAVLIRLDSPGSIFFRQKRVGRDGRVFEILKFRSMRQNMEAQHREAVRRLVENDAAYFEQSTGRRSFYKVTDETQVTRVGRWLRWTSLDELPQLVNVLLGQMSLVGPRPLPCYQVDLFAAWQQLRHEVRPGITGFWQVFGRSVVAHEDMVLMDAYYVMNWSLAMDLGIILRTAFVLLTGKGAV
jgi:exopolysaccharide biosynthesis polyprenyl glycosylphosphotransferase